MFIFMFLHTDMYNSEDQDFNDQLNLFTKYICDYFYLMKSFNF